MCLYLRADNKFDRLLDLWYNTTEIDKGIVMADIVNQRVNIAQQELLKRANRLKRIVASTKGKATSAGFSEGVRLVSDMIDGQSKLLDTVVFDAPKTALEQERNLMLMTGGMNQTVQEGIKASTDAIDAMLHTLEQMSR